MINDRLDLAISPVDALGEGSGLVFEEILTGRNVIACSPLHPLLSKRGYDAQELLKFPWIAPPPGSPLLADMDSIFISLGETEFKPSYSGGSLASIMNFMSNSYALTVLPFSVVFAYRNENKMSALPFKVPHPERAVGILRMEDAAKEPIVENFAMHLANGFKVFRNLLNQHEYAEASGTLLDVNPTSQS